MSRNKKIPNARKRLNIIIFSIVFVIILLVALFIFAFSIDYFRLRRVKIDGMIRSNSFDILSQAGIEQDKNIFFISQDNIKNNIEKDTLLIVKNISLSPPDMIRIVIEEREAIAILEYDGFLVELTKDKYIIKKESIYNYNLPYLTGFEINLNDNMVADKYTSYMLGVLDHLYENNIDVFNMISEIDASGPDLIIYTRGYNTKVVVEKYISSEKFVKLASIVSLLKENSEQVNEIDFRFDEAIIKY